MVDFALHGRFIGIISSFPLRNKEAAILKPTAGGQTLSHPPSVGQVVPQFIVCVGGESVLSPHQVFSR